MVDTKRGRIAPYAGFIYTLDIGVLVAPSVNLQIGRGVIGRLIMFGRKQQNLNFTMYKNWQSVCCFSSLHFFPANQRMNSFANKWEFNRQVERVRVEK